MGAERYIRSGGAKLFVRDVGSGTPIVVLHGGPDFDHTYLLPELDVLADAHRLVYYDQRGRGRSAAGELREDVGIDSELADLDRVIDDTGVPAVAVLGHSWGGLLAMEYTIRHPERVSHLVLLGTAPASAPEWVELRAHLRAGRSADDLAQLTSIAASAAYLAGEPEAELAYYRAHFRMTVDSPERLEAIVGRLRVHFTANTVLAARAIEARLYEQTCLRDEYDLVPALVRAGVPTLIVHGDGDFVPLEMALRIAAAVPGGRCEVLAGCGHFAYAERPDLVRAAIAAFVR
jgi:proline-specific peptidase